MSREIELTQGFVAIVDDEDYEWLSQWKWHAKKSRSQWYAVKTGTVRMHRLIVGAADGDIVDHINHNSLDNRRSNLRFATKTENLRNGHNPRGKRYLKGVTRSGEKWLAYLCLGTFESKDAAAKAYDDAAVKIWGEHVFLNGRDGEK